MNILRNVKNVKIKSINHDSYIIKNDKNFLCTNNTTILDIENICKQKKIPNCTSAIYITDYDNLTIDGGVIPSVALPNVESKLLLSSILNMNPENYELKKTFSIFTTTDKYIKKLLPINTKNINFNKNYIGKDYITTLLQQGSGLTLSHYDEFGLGFIGFIPDCCDCVIKLWFVAAENNSRCANSCSYISTPQMSVDKHILKLLKAVDLGDMIIFIQLPGSTFKLGTSYAHAVLTLFTTDYIRDNKHQLTILTGYPCNNNFTKLPPLITKGILSKAGTENSLIFSEDKKKHLRYNLKNLSSKKVSDLITTRDKKINNAKNCQTNKKRKIDSNKNLSLRFTKQKKGMLFSFV